MCSSLFIMKTTGSIFQNRLKFNWFFSKLVIPSCKKKCNTSIIRSSMVQQCDSCSIDERIIEVLHFSMASTLPFVSSLPEKVSTTDSLRKLRRSNSEPFLVDKKVTVLPVSEHKVLEFFGCMPLQSYTQDKHSTSRLRRSISEPEMKNKVHAVCQHDVSEFCGIKHLQYCTPEEHRIMSCENEGLPKCLAMLHGAFQIRIDTILSVPNERLHDLVSQLASPKIGKYWPQNFVAAMLKMQCDVSGADYALRWRYCAERGGMIVIGAYTPLYRERQTEGETGTQAFAEANIAVVVKSSMDSAVGRSHQSYKTIFINVDTCTFFTRKEMAMQHGIKSICFTRDPQGDIIEFGSQNPDWESSKECCMVE